MKDGLYPDRRQNLVILRFACLIKYEVKIIVLYGECTQNTDKICVKHGKCYRWVNRSVPTATDDQKSESDATTGNDTQLETEGPVTQIENTSTTDVENNVGRPSEHVKSDSENNLPPFRRSTRNKKKPIRFQDDSFTEPGDNSVSSDGHRFYKVKRILAKKLIDGTWSYLVHFAGEPAQNACWVKELQLDTKTRKLVRIRPPPQIL